MLDNLCTRWCFEELIKHIYSTCSRFYKLVINVFDNIQIQVITSVAIFAENRTQICTKISKIIIGELIVLYKCPQSLSSGCSRGVSRHDPCTQ